jgi:predicted DNA-binding WGR domain protein
VRHFEFKDDKSNKFWQIEQSDSELNLRWGKIGTQGQSQTKSFDNEAKASAAMTKLVKEKTGKGYVEIAVDENATIGATAPKPKAEPAEKTRAEPISDTPAESTPQVSAATILSQAAACSDIIKPAGKTPPWLANGEPITLPKDLSIQALTNRAHPGEKPELNDKLSWVKFRNNLYKNNNIVTDFAATSAGLRQVYEASWQRLAEQQLEGSIESDAVLFALAVRSNSSYLETVKTVDFTEFLVARKGLPYAIDVLLLAQGINVEATWDRSSQKHHYSLNEEIALPLGGGGWGSSYSAAEKHFRKLLSCADDAEWLICVDKLIVGLPSLHITRQPLIAFLLPERPDIANQLANELTQLAANETTPWLQLVATDETALKSLGKMKRSPYGYGVLGYEWVIATLIAERGINAVQVLAYGADIESCGNALMHIGTPEAITALAQVAGQGKAFLARLIDAAHRWPLAAMPAIAELLASNHKDSGMLSACLSNLLLANPEQVAQLLPWMSTAAQAQVQDLIARVSGPVELADEADLPLVLVSPPWLQKKKKREAAVLALEPLNLAPVLDLTDEEKKQWLALNGWEEKRFQAAAKNMNTLANELGFQIYQSGNRKSLNEAAAIAIRNRNTQGLIDAWKAQLAQTSWSNLSMRFTSLLPDEMALALWNSLSTHPCSGEGYMVAKFGEAALPGLINAVRSRPTELTTIWGHVGACVLAPLIARAYLKLKTLRSEAQQWLCKYPHHSAIGLIPAALGKKGEAKDCATSALRMLATQGHEALIMQTGEAYGNPEVIDALRAMLDEDPLDRFPSKISKSPDFYQPAGWRRPLLKSSNKALPDSALEHLGTMLRFPVSEGLYEGINQVKQACDPDSLADFAWDMFSAWLFAAAPSKEGWAFMSLGLFGTDDTARKLTPFIRAWPGEAQHQRAVNGLEVLNQIGSDVALMLLNGIAQKVKFKGLQDRAREKIAAIAEARELTIEELEDRLAPDLGLDENGSLRLDFGDRQFTVSFDETLKPFVRDMDGTRLKDLPKPKKTDHQELANEAVNIFKLLKKDARTVAAQQVVRLEIAMCQRRRWTPELFELFLVRHPLVRHLVQRLAWGVYLVDDASTHGGKLLDCFRVAEDGSLTTAEDDEYTLPQGDNVRIGIPHALELPEHQAAGFGQLFADYELLQPFVQLGRDTYSLTEQERESRELLRWKGAVVPTGRILGLANKGWRRGDAQDGGAILDFIKPIDRQLGFSLSFEPCIIVGMVDEYPEQTLETVVIDEGQYYWQRTEERKPFTIVDDIVISELIRDMEALRA